MQEKNLFFKRVLLGVCLLAVCWLPVRAEVLPGDVDGDGKVNINDVTALINYLLKQDASLIVQENADVDASGRVNIDDVTTLIGLLLKGGSGTNPDPVESDWVDLGLPSGTLWATRNVGASAPEDYGDYFAWGETEPKSYYDWDTYKWYQAYKDANGDWHSGFTKYCTDSVSGLDGFVDNKTELDPEDDAACAHYPGGRMPSTVQIWELCGCCTFQWTLCNGVNGQLVTGPNGNTIFLPAAGYRYYGGSLDDAASIGYYWSRTVHYMIEDLAGILLFNSSNVYWDDHDVRSFGRTVRAVRVP